MDRAQLAFEPVELLGDEVRFELPGTDVYKRQVPDSFKACSNTIGANERKSAGVRTGL